MLRTQLLYPPSISVMPNRVYFSIQIFLVEPVEFFWGDPELLSASFWPEWRWLSNRGQVQYNPCKIQITWHHKQEKTHSVHWHATTSTFRVNFKYGRGRMKHRTYLGIIFKCTWVFLHEFFFCFASFYFFMSFNSTTSSHYLRGYAQRPPCRLSRYSSRDQSRCHFVQQWKIVLNTTGRRTCAVFRQLASERQ